MMTASAVASSPPAVRPEDYPHVPPDRLPHLLDWKWAMDEQKKGEAGAFALFDGLNVAVYEQRVVGAAAPGPNTLTLRARVAEQLGVDPDRVVITSLVNDFSL